MRGALKFLLIGCLILPAACETTAADPPATSKVLMGTFDSRAIAIAYANSDFARRELDKVKAEYEAAKASGNVARVAEIDREMEALQHHRHEQGFSAASVDDILLTVRPHLPEIAAKAGVEVIVSQWDLVYQADGVTFRDVTNLMIEPFHPNEKTYEFIRGIRDQKPVPLTELRKPPKH